MDTLNTFTLLFHVLIAAAIIGLVLVQKGKGADAGAGFGAGASGTVFGARGSSNFLSRSTAIAAFLFFVTSLSLAYLNSNRQVETSLLDQSAIEADSIIPDEAEEFSSDSLDLPPLMDLEQAELETNFSDSLPEVPEFQDSSRN
ncbi:MAG: preprotein translocase subunit SecG [Pseudomonadota bacterium]|nr:preprotein translocase subunit SecG [Pseudomonadota bacterium]